MHYAPGLGSRNVAMAFKSTGLQRQGSPSPAPSGRAWEDLRREARMLEGELDVKLSAYNKLASGFEANYKLRDGSSAAAEQLSQSKAVDIEALLTRLSDCNEAMAALLATPGGGAEGRSHLLARHRDILADYSAEFRRLSAALGEARDRGQLLAGSGESSSHVSLQVQGGSGALLRERAAIQGASAALDQVLVQAGSVSTSLVEQRNFFSNISDKVLKVGASFPVVNSLLNSIRRKKSKDTLVLGAVIAACTLFTLLYILFK